MRELFNNKTLIRVAWRLALSLVIVFIGIFIIDKAIKAEVIRAALAI